MTEPLKPYITPDGGLCQRDTRTIIWYPGEPTVRTNGDFSREDFLAIAEHMKNAAKSERADALINLIKAKPVLPKGDGQA